MLAEINWESAYKTLEQQYEHTLLAIANTFDEIESRAAMAKPPTIHNIHAEVREIGAEFVVSASGAELEYSFAVRGGGRNLLAVPFGPKNSVNFVSETFSGEIECEVNVRSTTSPDRIVSMVSQKITCQRGRAA